jgi:hypothetical protein
VFLTIALPYLFGDPTLGNRYVGIGLFFFFHLVYVHARRRGLTSSHRVVALLTAFTAVVTCITTLNALGVQRFASRMIKSSDEYSWYARSLNVGGYELIYFLVYFALLLLFVAIDGSTFRVPGKLRAACFAVGVLAAVTIVMSNYFTALLLVGFGVMVILVYAKSLLWKACVGVIAAIGLSIALLMNDPTRSTPIEQLAGTSKFESRMAVLRSLLSGGEVRNSLAEAFERWPTIQASLAATAASPLLGRALESESLVDDTGELSIGNHSFFLDTFALYGIPLGIFCVYVSMSPIGVMGTSRCRPLKGLRLAIMATTGILLSLNTVSATIGIAVYFLFPTLHDYLSSRLVRSGQEARA